VLVPPHVPNPTGLILVNADNGERVYRKEFPPGALERFAFFADGKSFMTNEARPAVYETATGREQFSFPADSTYNFVLSPNGRFAAAMSGASQVSLWDLEKKKRAHELLTGMIPARLGNFSADGKSLLVTTLRTLRVFDTATGKERLSLGHCSRVTPRFSDDDRTLITTCDELRRTWDVSSKKTPKLVREQPRNPWEGICGRQVVGHSKDGRYFVDGKGRDNLKLCETATGKVIRGLDSYPHPIFGMFSRDASRLLIWHGAIGEDFDGFRLYDVATGKKTGQMATPERAGYYPALSNDGRSIAWADRVGAIHLHDGATGRPIRVLRSEKNICNDADLLFTPDGSHIIVATSHHDLFRKPDGVKWVTNPVRVYRVSDGKEISQFHANPKTTNRAMSWACAAVSRSGRLVAVAEKDSPAIRVFDVMKGKLLAEFDGHRGGVHGLAFSHDEQILASGGEDAIVTLWDVAGLK
jgi:WD40 repeat protein